MRKNTLSVYVAAGRNNNFNLLRFISAMLVLFSHSFALSVGSSDAEPLREYIGMTPGTIAVDIFFITSGFLVTRSLVSRGNVWNFLLSRALRIYPALIVSILITVVTCGLIFNYDGFFQFITSRTTLVFVLKNTVSLFGIDLELPGVFLDNPFRRCVNGSLWSLPIELGMYCSLAALWIVTVILKNKITYKWLPIGIVFISFFLHFIIYGVKYVDGSFWRLMLMFYFGGSYYVLKDLIAMRWAFFLILCSIAIMSSTVSPGIFFLTYSLVFPYIVIFLAYVPSGYLRTFNKFGDYSYGLYIYAFPVQQMIASAVQPISPEMMLFLSSLITFILAFTSWHIVEKKALNLKINANIPYVG